MINLFCQNCSFNNSSVKLLPIGLFKPDYYILGGAALEAETSSNELFTINHPTGMYLSNVLRTLGIDESNSRKFKLIRCFNKDNLYSNGYDDIIKCCGRYAEIDIQKTNPKIIIALGKEAAQYLLKERFTSVTAVRGRLYDVDINGKTFKVLPTFSPNYILNNQSKAQFFMNDIQHAMRFINGDLIDIGKKDLQYALDYSKFKQYYDEYLEDCEIPAYDLETNARDPRSEDAKMVGFSLAPNSSTGIYVVRKSLEYEMPERDWEQIVDLTVNQILKKKKLKVHNSMYEIPFTYNEWKFMIVDFIDTLAKARLYLGGRTGAGLKEQCQINLGYPDWEKDLYDYKNGFSTLLDKLKLYGKDMRERWDFQLMKIQGISALYEEYDRRATEGCLDKRTTECFEAINKLRDVVIKYYTTDTDYSIIMELIEQEIIRLVEIRYDGVFSYGFIPMKIITQYGAMDAVGTHDLDEHLDKQFVKMNNELNVNLFNGYEHIRKQFVAGAFMEMSGIHWDDEIAEEEKHYYIDLATKAAKSMINSKFLEDRLFQVGQSLLNQWIIDNDMMYIQAKYGNFEYKKSGIKVIINGQPQIVRWNRIIELVDDDYKNSRRELVIKLVRDEAAKIDNYVDLKWIFNPASTHSTTKDLINSILVTNEIRMAHFINKLSVLTDDPAFNLMKYPVSDRRLLNVLLEGKRFNKYVEEFNKALDDDSNDKDILDQMNEFEYFEMDSEVDEFTGEGEEGQDYKVKIKLTDRDIFNKFVQVLQECPIQSQELLKQAQESFKWSMEKINEPTIIEVHDYNLIAGVPEDDVSQWPDVYKFLVDFRMWKKCNKLITTYIDGNKVGRGSVWVVDKEDFQAGTELTRRKRKYDSNMKKNERELYVMQATYGVCTANSFRWRCLHGDTIIPLLDGRYVPIRDLVKEDLSDVWVYSYDESRGHVVPGKVIRGQQTGSNEKTIKITLDNGRQVISTPDHRFMMRDAHYREAKDLRVGDSLMPFYERLTNDGYKHLSNAYYNHKIVKIEEYEESDVYDIEVDKYHNFAIDSGIIVHNSGMHTLPAECSIKNFYNSRFPGGLIIMPDYSQMELRSLAGAANCKNMIDAFVGGADIHLQNAVKIFKKPADQITPAERRYSKMASFSIVYGATYRNFGMEFLNGDIALAKYIYDSFYEEYPEVRDFIAAKHEQVKKYGKITTATDMFMHCSPDLFKGDEGKALRVGQNAPIQNNASTAAGVVIYHAIEFIRQNNLKSKSVLFIHDSLEFDIHPAEFIYLSSQVVKLMNEVPMNTFNIPAKADLSVGRSLGEEVVVSKIEHNDKYTEAVLVCESYSREFDALIHQLKKTYRIVEWKDLVAPKPRFQSYNGLWISKKSLDREGYGINKYEVKREVTIAM